MPSLNYANYDFDTLKQQLRDILKVKNPVWDSYESSTVTTLIELFCYVAELQMYYIERQAQETYIETAQKRSSLINLAKLLNYQPARNISAVGTLRFYLSSAHTKNIYIPKFTSVSNSDGTKFITLDELTLYAGSTSVSGQGAQGQLIETEVVSDGSSGFEVNISDTLVENSRVFVYVDDVLWTKVSSFVESTTTDLHYRIIQNTDNTISVVFGDGTYGKKPPSSSIVKVQHIRSNGVDGNIYSTNIITTLDDTIYDIDGDIQTVSVTNSTTFLGGSDAETNDQLRYNAPRVFATGDRAVTKSDYISILGTYPSIATSNVWGENEETPPNSDYFNKVRICLLLQNWITASADFKQEISDFLEGKAQITVQYEFVDPTIINLEAVVDAWVQSDNSLSTVEAAIKAELDDLFELGTIKIGTSVRYSDIVRAIDEVAGVDYHNTKLVLKELIGSGDGNTDEFEFTLNMPRIKDKSVEIYDEDTLVGVSGSVDGSTTFTDSSSEARSGTANGNVKLSTRQSMFGLTAGYFDGTGDYVTYDIDTEFDFNSGVWTVDLFVYPEKSKAQTLFYMDSGASTDFIAGYISAANQVALAIRQSSSIVVDIASDSNAITLNEWNHIRFVENGDDYYIFVNGNLVAYVADSDRPAAYTSVIKVGSGYYGDFNGFIDEFRISDSVRGITAFNTPTSKYVNDVNTMLLLHFDGVGSISAVAGSGVTGTVDYSTGALSVSFFTAPTDGNSLYAKYQQIESNNDLVTDKNEIIKLTDKTVTVQYVS